MVNYISVFLQGLLLLIAESLQNSQEFEEEGSPSLVWIQKVACSQLAQALSSKYEIFFFFRGKDLIENC